jgi:uridine kinase
MRIAVSGAHHTGKTTLIDELIGSLSTFRVIDEPCYLLEDGGHAFAGMSYL